MEEIRTINDEKELSEIGCSFFLNHKDETLITSTELRWLKKDGNEWKSSNQRNVNRYINKVIGSKSNSKLDNIKVLLYKDPTKINPNNYIVPLIKAGADVRFKKMDNTIKICLCKNKLYISYATDIEHEVKKGVYYIGNHEDIPMIDYYENIFKKDFDTAIRITVKNDSLSYKDKWYQRFKKNIEEITPQERFLWAINALLAIILFFIGIFYK